MCKRNCPAILLRAVDRGGDNLDRRSRLGYSGFKVQTGILSGSIYGVGQRNRNASRYTSVPVPRLIRNGHEPHALRRAAINWRWSLADNIHVCC